MSQLSICTLNKFVILNYKFVFIEKWPQLVDLRKVDEESELTHIDRWTLAAGMRCTYSSFSLVYQYAHLTHIGLNLKESNHKAYSVWLNSSGIKRTLTICNKLFK